MNIGRMCACVCATMSLCVCVSVCVYVYVCVRRSDTTRHIVTYLIHQAHALLDVIKLCLHGGLQAVVVDRPRASDT